MTITFAGRIASNGLTGYGQETGNVAGLTLVADPTGAAGNVLRAHMAQGDTLAGGSYRSEVSTYSIRAAIGSRAWYWFETYIPEDWIPDSKLATIWQVHDIADGGDNSARKPPFECLIDGSELEFASAAATGDADDTPVYRDALWKMPLVTGRWIQWVLRADWNYTTGGALRIWRDRRMVYNESGFRNCYNDVLGLYPKLGVYVPLGLSAATPSRTVYHKGVVTGDNAYSTFDAFMAAAGSTDTELESVFTGALAAA